MDQLENLEEQLIETVRDNYAEIKRPVIAFVIFTT